MWRPVATSFRYRQENLRARARYEGLRGDGDITTFRLNEVTLTDPPTGTTRQLERLAHLQSDPWIKLMLLISDTLQRKALKNPRITGCLSAHQ
ncbi:unnamed protein product [Dibothriocephalus latus]|uniref:Uncharacterized protein n=1 Tax=Dibothriocephalus latus TaxID=60516 RepID=A0A3P7PW50_DIBLA|nr:unnamed protein product [Dibothriocephalus latus]